MPDHQRQPKLLESFQHAAQILTDQQKVVGGGEHADQADTLCDQSPQQLRPGSAVGHLWYECGGGNERVIRVNRLDDCVVSLVRPAADAQRVGHHGPADSVVL